MALFFLGLEFSAFLTFHNDLRRKYTDLHAYADQQDQYLDQYRTECARQDKKIQSQRYEIKMSVTWKIFDLFSVLKSFV